MIAEFLKKIFLLFILLGLTFFSLSNLLKPGFFPMHDDLQAMRLLQMDKCIKDGQIPCRWVPDMGYGYGYPQFNYYAPLPYYIMEIIHLSGVSYLDSVKLGFALSLVTGVFGMYLLASSLWGKVGGILSAILFNYAPYRAVDIFVRGAMGEAWGVAILPFVFWGARGMVLGEKKSELWFAVSLAVLLTSHNIVALITVPILFLWILFLGVLNKIYQLPDFVQRIKRIIFSFVWGILLSSFFVIPAFFERKFAHLETLLLGYFNYLAHFVSLRQLLFSSYWGYGTSELGPYDDVSLSVGLLVWVLPLLSLALLIFFKKKRIIALVLFFILIGWFSLFMSHQRSTFIWDHLAFLAYLQFPWRFLTLATFTFSVACGSLSEIFPKKGRLVIGYTSSIIFLTIFFNSSFFRPLKVINITDLEKFSGKNWDLQQTISIFDYLPIFAKTPPDKRAPEKPIVLEGEATILEGKKGTNWQDWRINIASEHAKIQLPIFYFPFWKVWDNGVLIPTNYNNELGLITVFLSRGEHSLSTRLTDTFVRLLANFGSLASLLAIPVYLKRVKG